MNDGALRALLVVYGFDGPKRIVSLLLQITAAGWNRDHQHMPNIVQFDDRVAVTVSGHLA